MAIHNRKIEYRIKPVTRYIVTRYESGDYANGVERIGNEYDTADVAYQVGYAVCKVEHERLGWPIDDMRIQYPRDPSEASTQGIPQEANAVPGPFAQISGADAQCAKFDLPRGGQYPGLSFGSLARS